MSVFEALLDALERMKAARPGDHSEEDRRFAIAITELEKVIAWYKTYLVDCG